MAKLWLFRISSGSLFLRSGPERGKGPPKVLISSWDTKNFFLLALTCTPKLSTNTELELINFPSVVTQHFTQL